MDTTTLAKAQKIIIKKTYISKNKTQHYSITFYNVPFFSNKDHRIYCSEIIYHDCTFQPNVELDNIDKYVYNIEYTNSEITINYAQLFLQNSFFSFEYHEEPSTTKLITIQYPKEN